MILVSKMRCASTRSESAFTAAERRRCPLVAPLQRSARTRGQHSASTAALPCCMRASCPPFKSKLSVLWVGATVSGGTPHHGVPCLGKLFICLAPFQSNPVAQAGARNATHKAARLRTSTWAAPATPSSRERRAKALGVPRVSICDQARVEPGCIAACCRACKAPPSVFSGRDTPPASASSATAACSSRASGAVGRSGLH